jgi:hypothetical protein
MSAQARAGFTLAETMITATIFSLVVIGILACHFAGLQMNEFIRPKVENCEYARHTLAQMIEEVRCANSIDIGTGTANTFTSAPPSGAQLGNAIRIYPTTNTSQYIYYYHDSNTATVIKQFLFGNSQTIIGTSVTNDLLFTMEDFKGTTLSNSQNNAVLSVLLQMERTTGMRGMSDVYQLRARMTRRNIL